MPVIMSDQSGPAPDYPYITYTVTSPYLPNGGPNYSTAVEDGNMVERFERHIDLVISFTALSGDPDEAMAYAMLMIEYYQNRASYELREVGVVVVSVSNVQNRDNLLTIDYERRCGIDVRFRVIDSASQGIDPIDSADIVPIDTAIFTIRT